MIFREVLLTTLVLMHYSTHYNCYNEWTRKPSSRCAAKLKLTQSSQFWCFMKLQRATYELLKPSKLEEVVSLKLGFETPHVRYFSWF